MVSNTIYGAIQHNRRAEDLDDRELAKEIKNVSAAWAIAENAAGNDKTPRLNGYEFQTTLNLQPLLIQLESRVSGPTRPNDPDAAALQELHSALKSSGSRDEYAQAIRLQGTLGTSERALSKGMHPVYAPNFN